MQNNMQICKNKLKKYAEYAKLYVKPISGIQNTNMCIFCIFAKNMHSHFAVWSYQIQTQTHSVWLSIFSRIHWHARAGSALNLGGSWSWWFSGCLHSPSQAQSSAVWQLDILCFVGNLKGMEPEIVLLINLCIPAWDHPGCNNLPVTWQGETDSQNTPRDATKHCMLEKSFLDQLHLAKWKGNITRNAHPMV